VNEMTLEEINQFSKEKTEAAVKPLMFAAIRFLFFLAAFAGLIAMPVIMQLANNISWESLDWTLSIWLTVTCIIFTGLLIFGLVIKAQKSMSRSIELENRMTELMEELNQQRSKQGLPKTVPSNAKGYPTLAYPDE
jgi:membrane protein insertase Oxa1/YidC/SpoIIIJ